MTDIKHPAPPTPQHEQAKAPDKLPGVMKENYEVETKPLPEPGSRDYVAGQPVDEEEQRKVDGEAAAKLKAAAEKARQDEQKALHRQTERKAPEDVHSKR